MNPAEVQAILDRHAYEAARSNPPEGFPKLPDIPRERYVDRLRGAGEEASLAQELGLRDPR